MRILTADSIFPITSPPVKNKVLVISDAGEIIEIASIEDFEPSAIETYTGALIPGFVNTHCHIELSHHKGKFAEHTGLPTFLKNVMSNSNSDKEIILQAIDEAESEMYANGIVAVGDISNTDHSFSRKSKKKLFYHTFIELLNLNPDTAHLTVEKGIELLTKAKSFGLHASLAPHAPYTVSETLIALITKHCYETGKPTSIHMLESNDENEFYIRGSGNFRKLYSDLNNAIAYFKPTGKTSLESLLPYINNEIKTLLVHNTIATQWDVEWAEDSNPNLFWCLCPNANMYIESRLPDIDMLMQHVQYITIGTDSLSSNTQLSVLDELRTIQDHFHFINTQDLFRWATLYGAKFLGIDNQFGSFELGKTPGILNVQNLSGNAYEITKNTTVCRIV